MLLVLGACAGNGLRTAEDGSFDPGQQSLNVPRFVEPGITTKLNRKRDAYGTTVETTDFQNGFVRITRFGPEYGAANSNVAITTNPRSLAALVQRDGPLREAALSDSEPVKHGSYVSTGTLLRFDMPRTAAPLRSCSYGRGLYGVNTDARFLGQVYNVTVEILACGTEREHPAFVRSLLQEVRPMTAEERARFDAMPLAPGAKRNML